MIKILHVLTLFVTVGLALGREFLLKFGIQTDYASIAAIGLAFTTLLVFRGVASILAVALLCMLISLPETALARIYLDHDMLLAAALILVLYPWLEKFIRDT